ncbi:MAG TPA: M55 family metallopeptidase [Blastocatellia bacterium]|nr:M55 family metallopeptidase [Blastocatellia bacterium]
MNLKATLASVVILLTIVPIGVSERRPLKVLLLFDMEGVSGATDFKYTSFSHPADYAEGRKSLTADVNAAIAGLKAAGASEIVVVDGHGSGNSTGPDVIEDQLLAPAKILYRDTPFDIYMDSYDHSFDAIAAVGMHAGAGNSVGFLSHTYTFEDVEYKVNGVPFNESMILAAGAARLKIPLIMISGDDQLEKEIRREMPWVKYASIKHAVDRTKAEALTREEASRRIEAAAREGLEKLAEAKLPDWPPPYRFALTFQDETQARAAALVPGAQLLSNPLSVQVRVNDFEEGYRLSVRLIGLAGIVSQGETLRGVLNAQPNGAQLRVNTTDWLYDRFLDRLPPPSQPAAGQRQRYWGAR